MLKRKTNFWNALLVCLTMNFSFNAVAEENRDKQTIIESNGFIHSVYFWLENPNSDKDRQVFEKYLTTFIENSQYVKSKFIGTVAPSEREVVDSSYTYALILTFSTKADQDKYQTEPVHLKFVENAQHLWKKVVVYDAFNSL